MSSLIPTTVILPSPQRNTASEIIIVNYCQWPPFLNYTSSGFSPHSCRFFSILFVPPVELSISHLPDSPSSLYAKKFHNSNNLLTVSSKNLRSWIRSIEPIDVKLPQSESCSAEFLLLQQRHLFFNILCAFGMAVEGTAFHKPCWKFRSLNRGRHWEWFKR